MTDPPDSGAGGPRPAASVPPAADPPGSESDRAGSAASVGSGPAGSADLVRAALTSARQAAAARRSVGDTSPPRWRRVAGRPRPGGWTASGADWADPQPFGRLIDGMLRDRGWERRSAEAAALARWDQLVGPDIAAHSSAVSLRDGQLTIAAESTAWATQLRLLTGGILQRLRSELGADVVTSLRIHGPTAPTWKHGPRSVRGRGPRDTYG